MQSRAALPAECHSGQKAHPRRGTRGLDELHAQAVLAESCGLKCKAWLYDSISLRSAALTRLAVTCPGPAFVAASLPLQNHSRRQPKPQHGIGPGRELAEAASGRSATQPHPAPCWQGPAAASTRLSLKSSGCGTLAQASCTAAVFLRSGAKRAELPILGSSCPIHCCHQRKAPKVL